MQRYTVNFIVDALSPGGELVLTMVEQQELSGPRTTRVSINACWQKTY